VSTETLPYVSSSAGTARVRVVSVPAFSWVHRTSQIRDFLLLYRDLATSEQNTCALAVVLPPRSPVVSSSPLLVCRRSFYSLSCLSFRFVCHQSCFYHSPQSPGCNPCLRLFRPTRFILTPIHQARAPKSCQISLFTLAPALPQPSGLVPQVFPNPQFCTRCPPPPSWL